MANSTTTELPNPFTPLAFLSPDLASQYEVSRYLYAATLGGYLWDIAVNLDSDYELLFKHRIRAPTVIYYLSRIFTLAYILTSFVFQVGNVPNCETLQVALGVCNVLSQSFTSLLFLLRVNAVWHGNRIVQAIFFLLWLGVVGGSVTVPVGTRAAHIGTTLNCINAEVKQYADLSVIMPMINDSAIFIAITYRILLGAVVADGNKARMRAFFGRRGLLPAVSSNLLHGGQHYYLIALCGNIVTLVLVESPVPPVYQAMCTIPVLAVINAMACIVYRKIKFGLINPDGMSIQSGGRSGSHINPNSNSLPLHLRRSQWRTDVDEPTGSVVHTRTLPVEVHILKESDAFADGK